jgi:single-strand DNA-binding protein
MNQIHIVGHLGQDAKTGQTQNGKTYAQFSVAVSDDYKQGEEWVKRSYWLNVVAWERIAKPYTKGQKLSVSGKMTSREYTDKEGQKRTAFEIVANEIHSIEREARTDNAPAPPEPNGTQAPQNTPQRQTESPANDDLPF